jgi:hypothetical protein
MSLLYRKISRGYQALYANAFTENTYPTNESGLYMGIAVTPITSVSINAYADFYHFPWLKYRVDAPSSGSEYAVQFNYTPNKEVQFYLRYRAEKKPVNVNPYGYTLNPVIAQPKQNLRTQFSFKLNAILTLRSRLELLWFDKRSADAENGYLVYTELLYKPLFKRLSGNARLQYFETDGYNSRLYAFENDVLYAYSIPVFYDKGYRYYLNINYDVTRQLSVWGRFAQTVYSNKNVIGSGLDEIKGNTKSELAVQAIWIF